MEDALAIELATTGDRDSSRRYKFAGGFSRKLRLSFLGVLLLSGVSLADPRDPSVVTDSGIAISTNEAPQLASLHKRHPIANMLDGRLETAWVFEGSRGRNPEIKVAIKKGLRIGRIGIVNGYAKSEGLYLANNRITRIEVRSKALAEPLSWKLNPNVRGMQFFALPVPVSGELYLRVVEVARGAKFPDTCISELTLIHDDGLRIGPADVLIGRSGGEYESLTLYKGGKEVLRFDESEIGEFFFAYGGTYVFFVHDSEMGRELGVSVVNLTTLRRAHVLDNYAIKRGSVTWRDSERRLEGLRIEAKSGGPVAKFSVPISLP